MTARGAEPDRHQLAHLLKEAGSALDPDGVAALIAGVLASPPEIGTSWHALVAEPTPPALADALEAMRAWLAEDFRDGLAAEDFARLPRAARLALLREELTARRLDGFIVPRADEHQGEYVPACGQRLAWLTGFTGSAGLAIVLAERAALFVDGRYTLQAAAQADTGLFEIRHLIDEPPARWLAGALRKGMVDRLRPLAAHAAGGRAPQSRRRARRGQPQAGRQPDRPDLAGAAGGAARAGGAAPRPLCRRERAGEARPARPRARRGRRRGGGADEPGIDRLAPQHPRRRRAAHAAAAVVCDPARGRQRHAVHRPAQARPRPRPPSRQRRRDRDAGAARARARRARRLRGAGPGRPGDRRVVDLRPARQGRRQDPARRRPVPVAESLQEPGRARRHPRRASPRRRRGHPLPRLARARGAKRRALRDRRQRPARSLAPRLARTSAT